MNKLTTLNGGLYTWSTHEANVYNLKGLYSGDIVKEKKKSMIIMSQERIEKISWEEKCQIANHNTLKIQELRY